MIIYTYTLYIYIIHVYAVHSRFLSERNIPQGIPQGTSPLYVRRLSLLCNRKPFAAFPPPPFPSLPPSLPPEESWRALPILQYLYFSMLKPRYIINYINKHRSPVISRTNVTTYSLGIFLFFFALCHDRK